MQRSENQASIVLIYLLRRRYSCWVWLARQKPTPRFPGSCWHNSVCASILLYFQCRVCISDDTLTNMVAKHKRVEPQHFDTIHQNLYFCGWIAMMKNQSFWKRVRIQGHAIWISWQKCSLCLYAIPSCLYVIPSRLHKVKYLKFRCSNQTWNEISRTNIICPLGWTGSECKTMRF